MHLVSDLYFVADNLASWASSFVCVNIQLNERKKMIINNENGRVCLISVSFARRWFNNTLSRSIGIINTLVACNALTRLKLDSMSIIVRSPLSLLHYYGHIYAYRIYFL